MKTWIVLTRSTRGILLLALGQGVSNWGQRSSSMGLGTYPKEAVKKPKTIEESAAEAEDRIVAAFSPDLSGSSFMDLVQGV